MNVKYHQARMARETDQMREYVGMLVPDKVLSYYALLRPWYSLE